MCGDEDEESFNAVHHEMGHIQYYMNYANLDPIFRVRKSILIISFWSVSLRVFRTERVQHFKKRLETAWSTRLKRQNT